MARRDVDASDEQRKCCLSNHGQRWEGAGRADGRYAWTSSIRAARLDGGMAGTSDDAVDGDLLRAGYRVHYRNIPNVTSFPTLVRTQCLGDFVWLLLQLCTISACRLDMK